MVQCPCAVNQIGALKFVTPQWSTPEMSRMTAFLRSPALHPDRPAACTSTYTTTAKCETVATLGIGNRFLKTRWFVDDEGLRLLSITRWFPCVFFSLLDHGSPHTTRTNRDDDRWNFVARSRHTRKSSFHSSFRRTITKVLCSAWGSQ